jgi:hypothetical protein
MLVVFGAYVLLMSGHTYSPDEETMLAASQALVVNGSWALPPSRALVEVTGADGQRYSQYGPAQSLAALPWVAVGRWVGDLFPKDQAGFPLRLVLGMYNALLAAGICGLFAALGLSLGYGRRAVVLTTPGLAFCTFLWPHSRTFFSEPLVALCLLGSFYLLVTHYRDTQGSRRDAIMLALSGGLFAAAIATKVQYAVALVAYLTYFAWNALSGRATSRITHHVSRFTFWLLGLSLGLLPLFLYNLAIFGGALTTGYGADLKGTFKTALYEGVFGLLLSPGKGLLWYAPPVALAVWGFTRLAGRSPAVAAFVGGLFLALVGFFGLYVFWPGDGSWGPRYLIPLLPFALLPALQAVEAAWGAASRWGRVAVWAVLGLGFVVNLLGVLVNFDTYINVEGDEAVRYWHPEASPIVGHARLLGQRAGEWSLRLLPQQRTLLLESGFSYSEGDKVQGEPLPRWTTGDGVIKVRPDAPVSVTLRLADHRPPELPRAVVAIIVDGHNLEIKGKPVEGQPISSDYSVPVSQHPTQIEIRSDTWNPSKFDKQGRNEDIGVRLDDLTVTGQNGPRKYKVVEAIPAPPYYPQPRWYYDPGTHHPADLWVTYLAEIGMGGKAMLGLALPVVLVGLGCLALGLRGLRAGRGA